MCLTCQSTPLFFFTMSPSCDEHTVRGLLSFRSRTRQRTSIKKGPRVGRHSSVVSSVPTILRRRVQIPSTPSMLFFNLYWNCNEKRKKINKKRPGLAQFIKEGTKNVNFFFVLVTFSHEMGAAIAQSICLSLPFCRQLGSSPKHPIYAFIFCSHVFSKFIFALRKEPKNKQKIVRVWPILKTFNNVSAVGCAQLTARSLLIPEYSGSNPVIGHFYWTTIYC